VFYKDSSGVVSGPIGEEDAQALLKADFFKESHSFRVIDADDFQSLNDQRTLNGAENPFSKTEPSSEKEEQKELEMSTVMRERNELRELTEAEGSMAAMRQKIIDKFKETMK
ncbi:hypothetical protein PENTCL1PPCAC_12946, partial [Pristionchus entomophagus]